VFGCNLSKELLKKRGSPTMVKFPVLCRMTNVTAVDYQRQNRRLVNTAQQDDDVISKYYLCSMLPPPCCRYKLRYVNVKITPVLPFLLTVALETIKNPATLTSYMKPHVMTMLSIPTTWRGITQ